MDKSKGAPSCTLPAATHQLGCGKAGLGSIDFFALGIKLTLHFVKGLGAAHTHRGPPRVP